MRIQLKTRTRFDKRNRIIESHVLQCVTLLMKFGDVAATY